MEEVIVMSMNPQHQPDRTLFAILNTIDRELSHHTYRDGCGFHSAKEPCDHCRPIIDLRRAIAVFFGNQAATDFTRHKLWWESPTTLSGPQIDKIEDK